MKKFSPKNLICIFTIFLFILTFKNTIAGEITDFEKYLGLYIWKEDGIIYIDEYPPVSMRNKMRKQDTFSTANNLNTVEEQFKVNDPNEYYTKKGYIFSPELGLFALALVNLKENDKVGLYKLYEKKLISLTERGLKVKIVGSSKNGKFVKIQKIGSNKTVWIEREALIKIKQ